MTADELWNDLYHKVGVAEGLTDEAAAMVRKALSQLMDEGICWRDSIISGFIVGETCQKIGEGEDSKEAREFMQNLQS